MEKFPLLLLGFLCLGLSNYVVVAQNKTNVNYLQSRAAQYFGVNCKMNLYMDNEFALSLEYLNASIYLNRDTVALNGFGKMFTKFWMDQLDSVNKIRSYINKRGGYVNTPGYYFKQDLNSVDFFSNETRIIYKFLRLEKSSNLKLLELHRATREDNTDEKSCIQKYKNIYGFYSLLNQQVRDPVSANFLDDNFSTLKMKRIEFLSRLLSRVSRLDSIGIHLIDNELREKF